MNRLARVVETLAVIALLIAIYLAACLWALARGKPPGPGPKPKDHPMNSPAFSKINWTAILAAAASIGVIFGVDIPPAQQLAIVGGIQAAQSLATVIFRTFMTGTK